MAPRSLLVSDQSAPWHLDAARGPSTPSFDDLVSASEKRGRYGEADHLGRLQVEHKLKPRYPQNRQVGWLLALEDARGIHASQSCNVHKARTITHQSACFDIFAKWID